MKSDSTWQSHGHSAQSIPVLTVSFTDLCPIPCTGPIGFCRVTEDDICIDAWHFTTGYLRPINLQPAIAAFIGCF